MLDQYPRTFARRTGFSNGARHVGALALGCAAALSAQAATSPGSSQLELQEIVVSATRVGENSLQNTPMAISVIKPGLFDSKGLGGISDFVGQLPSVYMQSQSPGENEIQVRGIVTNELDPTNSQARALVALYLDDSAITQQAFNPDLHVYDLERVEVIRGPQGTLYGAGAMAGTIRLITKKPDMRHFSAGADTSVSQTRGGGTNYSVRGVVNLPLQQDRLALRLTGYRSSDSGYVDNIELNAKHSNPAYATQGRAALRYTPVEELAVDASVTFARLDARGRSAVYPQLGDYAYESLTPERLQDYFKLYNFAVDWDVSFAHLISSTSYIQRQISAGQTVDPLVEAFFTPGIPLASSNVNANDVHEFQQELRLVSRSDERLRWISGTYFERQSRYYVQNIPVANFDSVFGNGIGDPTFNSRSLYGTPTPNDIFYGVISQVEQQFALFGEATYTLVPKLDVTLGLRYFHFTDDFNLNFTGIAGAFAPGQPNTGKGAQKSTGSNPRAVLSYHVTDNVMLYGEAARGFRFGGVNQPAPFSLCGAELTQLGLKQSPESFGPDSLWSYTIGEKGTFNGGRVVFNIDGFYINWQDVQTSHFLNCGYAFTQNKGKVRSRGIEWESKVRATRSLTMGVSGSFTNATANGAIENLGAADGDRVPFFPRTILAVSGDYKIAVGSGNVVANADYTYRSKAFTQFSPLNSLYRAVPSSVILNSSIGYELNRWSVSIFGTNLTNSHVVSDVEANTFGTVQPGDVQFWGRPRTIGVHFHIDF